MRKQLFYTATLLSFCISTPALAKDSSEKGFFNSDVFSLSKKKENAFDAASAIYVLSSEDIRRSGVTSIPEALRLVPGLQVARIDGNKWAISARGMNHQYSSKLLIMIDGRTIYTPIFSGAFWDNQDYVINDIERIEVIRGPGASIWGANAMNGIINIITKSAAETKGAYLSQTYGNNDNITEARYGGKVGSELDSYRVYAKHANRGGFRKLTDGSMNNDLSYNTSDYGTENKDGIVSDRAGFKYDILSMKDSTLSIHGDVFNSNSKNYFNANPVSTEGIDGYNKKTDGQNLVVNWNKNFSSKSSMTFQGYFDRSNLDVGLFKAKETTYSADFQHFYNFSKDNQFIWGFGYKNVIDNTQSNDVYSSTGTAYKPLSYNPRYRNIETYSAFIQDKIGIIADKFYLTLGSKFEHNDQTGFEYQPNARLTYYPSRNQTIWAAVSRAIRVPTMGEDSINITVNSVNTGNANTVVTNGSAAAQSETVLSYELGYKVKPTRRTNIDISTFINQYSRLGTFDAVNPDSNGYGTPTASNNGRAITYGFEIDTKWQVLDSWKLEASYDFIKMDIKLNAASNENTSPISDLNSDKLTYFMNATPRNQFRLRSLYDVTSKIEFDNMLYYVDSLPGKTSTEKGVPAYVRWDTRLGYLMTKNLDLSFGIQNLLDDRHQEFSAGLFNNKVEIGRTYYAKAVLQF